MPLFLIAFSAILLYILAYLFYGRILKKAFKLDPEIKTPAATINDGVDYIPTKPVILLGQHFAAIAAVGPIAGPIIAGREYGWLAGLLWIVFGAIFIGGVHDFSALVASTRSGGSSVALVVKDFIGKKAYYLFLAFIWLSLMYVITVFADLTSATFVKPPYGGGVATSSFFYLILAVLLGISLYKLHLPLAPLTAIFIILLLLGIHFGQFFPIKLPEIFGTSRQTWNVVIIAYCIVASVIPMWLLLQPRGYLGGFMLYATFVVGIIGVLGGGFKIEFPAFTGARLFGFTTTGVLFPLMFTTIACGACSGFHGLVSSGTTSKQLHKETHAVIVGYGGMLLESLVAVIAISTLILTGSTITAKGLDPDEIYARGLATFAGIFGVSFGLAITFGKLAFATFIYDTLDVAMRLARYVFQELIGLKTLAGAITATLISAVLPLLGVFTQVRGPDGNPVPVWKIFWPLFGTSNQMLAALTLIAITVWMKKNKMNWIITGIPMIFMLVVTFSSLLIIILPYITFQKPLDSIGITGFILLVIAVLYSIESIISLKK